MARRIRYQLDKVAVEPGEERAATWTFGGQAMAGTEYTYLVRDNNFPARYQWEFVIRIPRGRDERIEVRPRTSPNVKAWAELPDRSLTFSRATKGSARGKWYCQVALADPTGNRSRDIVRGDERQRLPQWFEGLKGRMRLKAKVRNTKGTDGEALVLLVPAADYAGMIRLFFATKVWVLKERFVLSAAL
jgi:hypothetical protein